MQKNLLFELKFNGGSGGCNVVLHEFRTFSQKPLCQQLYFYTSNECQCIMSCMQNVIDTIYSSAILLLEDLLLLILIYFRSFKVFWQLTFTNYLRKKKLLRFTCSRKVLVWIGGFKFVVFFFFFFFWHCLKCVIETCQKCIITGIELNIECLCIAQTYACN